MVTIRVRNYGDKLYGIMVTAYFGFGLMVTPVFDVTIIPWSKGVVTIIPYSKTAVTTILYKFLASKLSPYIQRIMVTSIYKLSP